MCLRCSAGIWKQVFIENTLLYYVLQLPPTAETARRKIFATDHRGVKIKHTLQVFASVGPRKEGNQVFMVLWIFGLSWLFYSVVMSLCLYHRNILIKHEFISWVRRKQSDEREALRSLLQERVCAFHDLWPATVPIYIITVSSPDRKLLVFDMSCIMACHELWHELCPWHELHHQR